MPDEAASLERPTLKGWAVHVLPDGLEVRLPLYDPSPATNNKPIQDDDVPAGAVWVRDEPLEAAAPSPARAEFLARLDDAVMLDEIRAVVADAIREGVL